MIRGDILKTWKRFIAKLLIMALIVTGTDLYWIDMSGMDKVLASVSEYVNDSYDAYKELLKSKEEVDKASVYTISNKIASSLGVSLRANDTYVTSASSTYNNVTTWSRSNQNVMNGLYTLNQKIPTATAQVKSGDWLTKSKYEAMAGTPTTEPLFITMGGTQWIVDLQYRYVKAPYTRKWNLNSNYVNYRYYKIGDLGGLDDMQDITYRATKEADFDEDPEKTMMVKAPNGEKVYNYAYNFFEGVIDPDTQEPRETASGKPVMPTIHHTALNGDTHDIQTYLADKFCDENGTEFSTKKVAPAKGLNISEDFKDETDPLLDTKYVSPNLARAIKVKQQIYTMIKNYIDAWNGQDDNYRADQGTYDIDGIDSSESLDDKLTFMYTYLGMVRHATKQGTDRASSGDTYSSKGILYPAIVTYLYDWEEYLKHNNMTTNYGSTHFEFKNWSNGSPIDAIVKKLKSAPKQTTSASDAEALFPLYIENIPESKIVSAGDKGISNVTSKDIPADLSYAKIAASKAGSSVCVAIQNTGGLLEFGGSGKKPMSITNAEAAEDPSGRTFNGSSWCDLPTLYYRAIYSLLLNYGCMFYLDELKDLFKDDTNTGGMKIGISTELSGISANEYNKQVNANLAVIFGQGPHTTSETHNTYLPLAEFPRGGDLDGEMDDDTRVFAHSYIQNLSIGVIASSGMHVPSYTYGVRFTVQDDASPGVDIKVSSKTFLVRDHKANSHTHSTLEHCIDFKWLECEHANQGTCNESTHTGSNKCSNDCHSKSFKKCLGPFKVVGTYTDKKDWQCETCGYEVTEPISINLSKEPDDGTAGTNDDPRAHTCQLCGGDQGNQNWTCPLKFEKHKHYIIDGAKPTNGGNQPKLENHEKRVYTHTYNVSVSASYAKNVSYDGGSTMWVESPKSGGASDQLVQKFSNVQWLDVTSYTLWQMNHGTVKGLASILASPQSTNNLSTFANNELVTKAVNQMGYTVYDNKLTDAKVSLESDKLAHNTIYTTLNENDWASKGVIANSWNIGSSGNTGYNHVVSLERFSYKGGRGDPKIFGTKITYNKGDTPLLRAASSGLDASSFINNDHSAFKIVNELSDSTTQVVELKYDPMSQGGRSHSTFNGFYNQALAHTFYFADLSDATGTYLSAHPKLSYGNSLRVQGDYLSLDKTNGDKLTLAGMLYDTWNERFAPSNDANFSRYSSGKFSLLPNGKNKLTVFESTCKWIPARLSIIFNRNSYDNLYFVADNITNVVDCWIIHSYCKGINGDVHVPWDGMASGAISGTGECKGIYCSGRPLQGATTTDKGSVNIATHRGNRSTGVDYSFVVGGSGCRDYVYIGSSGVKSGLTRPIKIADVLSEGRSFYDQFKTLDIDGSQCGNAVSIGGNTITVQLNHYLAEGMNTDKMMTSAVNSNGVTSELENSMPYIGYQSKGIGTKDITIDGSGNTQRGYYSGFKTDFDPTNTFVSTGGSLDSGFEKFGVSSKKDDIKSGSTPNNMYPGSDFSVNYPWLSSLNVNRYTANGYYKTGQASVRYNKVGEQSNVCGDISHNSNLNSPVNELLLTTNYIKDLPIYGGHSNSKSDNKANAYNYLNSIVIYNPVSTQSAHIVTPTKYMPDAANNNSGLKTELVDGVEKNFIFEHIAAKRDTRVAYKYDLNNDSSEQYLSGSGIVSKKSKKKDSTNKVLKKKSELDTKAYTVDDYQIDNSSGLTAEFKTSEIDSGSASFQVEQSGEYSLTRIDTTNHWVSSKVHLVENDIISFSEKSKAVILEMGTNNFTLPWSNIKSAYKNLQDYYRTNLNNPVSGKDEDSETLPDGIDREKLKQIINYGKENPSVLNSGIPMFKGMKMSIGGDLKLRAGSLLKLSLDVTKSGEDGSPLVSEALRLDTDAMPNIKVISNTKIAPGVSGEKFTYTWYLEATQETQLSGIPILVDKDCFIWNTNNILEAEKVVLMSLSNKTGSTPIENVTSYDFFYGRTIYSDNSSTRTTFYNKNVVDVRSSYNIDGIDVTKSAGMYIGLNGGTTTVTLKEEALNNPHKVPNTDWRYYVLGWKTTDGQVITSPTSDLLFNSSTKLIIPSTGKRVTVGKLQLKSDRKSLAVYRGLNGSYGLIDVNSNGTISKRESDYTGYKVTEGTFDMIQYGNDSLTPMTGKVIVSGKPWSSYSETSGEDVGDWITSYAFECVFRTTNGDNSSEVNNPNNIAYDIKDSMYLGHRWNEDTESLWQKDWEEKKTEVYEFSDDDYNKVFADALSLDDEYTIYWDNYTDLVPNGDGSKSNLLNTSIEIGKGWDCAVNGNDSNKLGNLENNKYWKVYSSKNGSPSVTNTEKWIYSKYVIFNVDMYAFTTSSEPYVYDDELVENYNDSQKWDPTTPAFKNNGKPNTIVYIPAGERVYLGKYYASDFPGDDSGRFSDFGKNKNYTYHFWVPLSDGESDNNVTATYVVNSINGVLLDSDRISHKYKNKPASISGSTPKYTVTVEPKSTARCRLGESASVIKDEWGNPVLNAYGTYMDNNLEYITRFDLSGTDNSEIVQHNKEGYTRSGNSLNSQSISLVGRVGGLTVIDNGDPRYQDTFKNPDENLPGDDKDYWAIAPIVRAIKKYSNKEFEEGSQRKYLTDEIDVRGRYICHNDSCGLKTALSTDSYNDTAWFRSKSYIDDHRDILPMTYEFNVHEELRNSLTTTKLGYETYCTIDTVGNYYGSKGSRPNQSATDYVNKNLDFGQTKVQVHPMYVGLNSKTGKFEPVDVYMRRGSSYTLINAGSLYYGKNEADKAFANGSPKDEGPYYMDDCFDATYSSVIDTNTAGTSDTNKDGNDDTYALDQSMLRRSITNIEANTTYNVVHNHANNLNEINSFKDGVTTSILDPNNYTSNDSIGSEGLDYKYVYGNAQMLFLRECNRTFVGGTTLALNQKKTGTEINANETHIKSTIENAQRYSQRWYFGIGLPSSVVFVPHGSTPIDTPNKTEYSYVLTLIDVYAVGEKWALHYESPVSEEDIDLGEPYSKDDWNVYKETFPHAIPVCVYDLTQTTSAEDQSSRGSH